MIQLEPPLGLHRWFVAEDAVYSTMVDEFWGTWGNFFLFVSIAYLPLVGLARLLWKPMPALNLRQWRLIHNIGFCIFSVLGTIELTPLALKTLLGASSFKETVCGGYFQTLPESYWIMIFEMSKVFELLETFYFVMEKRDIPFIHWYHHQMTFLFCTSSLYFKDTAVVYYAWMNYAVHAFMYFYYCVATLTKSKPSWAILVTVSQILQMFIGTAVSFQSFWCENANIYNTLLGFGMYCTYIYLFVELFVGRYFGRRSRSKNTKKE